MTTSLPGSAYDFVYIYLDAILPKGPYRVTEVTFSSVRIAVQSSVKGFCKG